MRAWPVWAGWLTAALLPAPVVSAVDWVALVAAGEREWSRSPHSDRPVACATCHYDPDAIRGWAASFPKVRPLPPPDALVMTLLQATAEAVARHYGPAGPRPAAIAITTFLTASGAGLPITPGVTQAQAVLPSRLQALAGEGSGAPAPTPATLAGPAGYALPRLATRYRAVAPTEGPAQGPTGGRRAATGSQKRGLHLLRS